MALELLIWEIVVAFAGIGYLAGIIFKTPHLFVLGCALLIGSGALLWGFNGLNLGSQANYNPQTQVITYNPINITMENIGLSMLALALIGVGIMSAMSIDFSSQIKTRSKSVFHY